MGRPRTATNILDARGSFRTHPEIKRPNEPIVTTPFRNEHPEYFTDDQEICWRDVVGMAPAGVLTGADHIVVEIVACLLAEFRRSPDDMQVSRITRLTSEMAKIGLSPSARASLSVGQSPANEFDDV